MKFTEQIAKQFREIQLNGKWVAFTNLKIELEDVTLEEANTKVGSLNTIALLAFHINYYIEGLNKAFENGTLDIKDKFSFDMPPIESEEEWEKFKNKVYSDAEQYAKAIEQMPDKKLSEPFIEEKYGNYFRNLTCMIEHTYYHLGQIVIIKKLIRAQK